MGVIDSSDSTLRPVVTCDFIGRLGNQMWQLASTVQFALQNGYEVGFPSTSLNPSEWPVYFKNLPKRRGKSRVFQEKKMGVYSPIPTNYGSVRLHGFFQNYQYINHPWTIRKVKELIGYEDQDPVPGVAMHIRRGDYLKHSEGYPVLSETEYYEKAIACALPKNRPIIFTDDPLWARSQWPLWDIRPAGNPLQDLFSMSRFQDQIIANSSFSYWAAMLNPNPNKFVVCPHHSQYYGPANKHIDTTNLYPKSWHQIKYLN
ncbi:alpha-1,2-fucosyltransferase [Moorena sp. SIO3H5]|uniref:alpha-1,2-fucosyltransferase n=1 Tax=Moorena sp. SIO3H5 TaxID=2607834 RepID=UPI0013B639FA|nr:alpha-1,2-fucosyltransferase [Moorena sp. SIO3H5]NEO72140.1 alpha-1,2-fucosyltransferase [Moorena sp. SIO3H5]